MDVVDYVHRRASELVKAGQLRAREQLVRLSTNPGNVFPTRALVGSLKHLIPHHASDLGGGLLHYNPSIDDNWDVV